MPFKPGVSGNPNGRPKGKRALTEALEKWGHKTVIYEGKPIAGRRLLSHLVWQGVLTGTIIFPDSSILHLGSADWKDFVKFVFTQIDGPAMAAIDVTSNGESIAPETLSPSEIAARVAALKAIQDVKE